MRDLALRSELAALGVHFLPTAVTTDDGNRFRAWGRDFRVAADANIAVVTAAEREALTALRVAMDAQPGLITATSAGIPAFLTNIIDPEVIRVITTPMRAAEILGETQKGDWTTLSTQFPLVEGGGQVSSYGDHNNNGTTDANVNYVPRQSFHFQTIERWGEREAAIWGVAAISKKAELDMAAALVLGKFRNRSYFFGIANLQNYGLLNDPSLPAAISPATKAAGGTSWNNATAQEIFQDVLALFTQLQTQMGSNLEMNDPIVLVLSTIRYSALAKVSQFNVSALTTIKQTFPNMRIETAPEYTTGSGELMQMILPTFDGLRSTYAAFTEKMRAHPLVTGLSSWMQKLSGGTWGAIIRRPIAVAQMLGI